MLGLTGIYSSQVASYKKRIDTDATAVINAAGLSANAHKAYVNTMVTNCKSAGLWTKCTAIYGFIGGTAAAHKLNFKNPADTDAAFRLIFTGAAWTHDANGIKPAGGGAYADTKINAFTNLTLNDVHLSMMSSAFGLVFSSSTAAELGAQVGSTTTSRTVLVLRASNASIWDSYDTVISQGRNTFTNNSLNGLMGIGSRTAANNSVYYRGFFTANSITVLNSISTTGGTPPNANIIINGYNSANTVNVTRIYMFVSVGGGLTQIEADKLFKIVKSCQIIVDRLRS